MEYEIITLNEAKAAGFTARTNNSAPDMSAVIGGTWQRFFAEDGYAALRKTLEKRLGKAAEFEWYLKNFYLNELKL